ncbi:MAG: hypothetical protein KDI82_08685 [Gammaproteobacteria bacterium]|nr:hypothetical protein [Gammaproteobacteria bacterium]
MPTHVSIRQSILTVTAGALLALSPFVGAASQCKGMSEQACADDSACTWVQGYTRKDGRAVSSHCKLSRGSRSSAADVPSALQVVRSK